MAGIKTKRVAAKELQKGMTINTFMGYKTIMDFKKYEGPFDFVLNVMIFEDGVSMSNTTQDYYDVVMSVE